jgi:hypothetical protein
MLRPYDEDEAPWLFWGSLNLSIAALGSGMLFAYYPPAAGRSGRRARNVGVCLGVVTLAISLSCIPVNGYIWGFKRSHDGMNLGHLGLAMHNYAGTYQGKLPQASFGGPDQPGQLSWRVAILPFLEEEELFKEFHLDEPWDSPHNIQLLPRMPAIFQSVANRGPPHTTCFQVITGSGGTFRDNRVVLLPGGFNPRGTSNTILIAEAAEPVPWTKPADLVFERDGPLPKFGGSRGYFFILMPDRTVRAIAWNKLPTDALRAALTPDNPERIPFPD